MVRLLPKIWGYSAWVVVSLQIKNVRFVPATFSIMTAGAGYFIPNIPNKRQQAAFVSSSAGTHDSGFLFIGKLKDSLTACGGKLIRTPMIL
jgi:hypothetical protein